MITWNDRSVSLSADINAISLVGARQEKNIILRLKTILNFLYKSEEIIFFSFLNCSYIVVICFVYTVHQQNWYHSNRT